MLKRIDNIIKKFNMIDKEDKIVVGVSGGADSICLLHILKELSKDYPFEITAVHVNHGLRGKEADEDESFVRDICRQWDISFNAFHIDIKEEAKRRKSSEEEAGRKARYEIFEKLRKEINANKIAVAHNMNDQAETVLMQLFRGSGMKGLAGIPLIRANIIRPLLAVSREEIEDYCKNNHIPFRQDSTNVLNIYTRNKIRNELIPLIKENFNPNIVGSLYNLAHLLREEDDYLESIAQESFKQVLKEKNTDYIVLDNNIFNSYNIVIQRRLLRIAIKELIGNIKDIEYNHITDIIELSYKGTGKRISLPRGLVVKKQYDDLLLQVSENKDLSFCYNIPTQGSIVIKEAGIKVETRILDKKTFKLFNQNTYTKSFDYDKIKDTLQIRTRCEGDRIFFEEGSKKLKKFFIDEKIPKDNRNQIPLLADGNRILWVIGYRYSDFYKITSSTNKVLEVKVININ
ncbi:MAG: tRNA lysidine(34) synthetase TilS [Epulopiscium sp.]|nr:tRNA lysidine(34) synthetase TilS [Candidatus Epulonipiscium sp.]